MHKILSFLFVLTGITGLAQSSAGLALIPLPKEVIRKEGIFTIDPNTQIRVADGAQVLQPVADYLAAYLYRAAGLELQVSGEGSKTNEIEFSLDAAISGAEAYRLEVGPERIRIRAKAGAGAFYAVQTLLQLLQGEREGDTPRPIEVPAVQITDAPRFEYRGMHLDVARHFFPVSFIKRYIDLLAMHKFNRFHWHLTEDQGWRIEIKKYPRLQEVAAWRKETLIGHYSDQPHQFDGKRYGGYYTQDEVREVVRYAAERFITVVPEIELPGHSLAALSAYPELACTAGPFEAATKWGIFEDVFCPKEETFTFLENVLTEVIELFPSEYIHIGGDECPKTRWESCAHCQALIKKEGLKDEHELQSYFIRRIERFINSKGRQIIGWDEILEGGLAPNATVMSWRGIKGGIAAAKEGHKVIMTPTSHCYLDYYQSDAEGEPLAIGGFLPLEKVYNYEPIPDELTAEEARFILGAQGNVWTEYMPTEAQVEYMAFPRALAIAELTWTPREQKNYADFTARLVRHFDRLDAKNLNYSRALFQVKAETRPAAPGSAAVVFSSLDPKAEIRYTTDGSAPGPGSPLYTAPVSLSAPTLLKSAAFQGASRKSSVLSLQFEPHLVTGKPVVLADPPSPNYSLGGPQALVNGFIGSDTRYGDSEWLGWAGKDMEALIDLGARVPVSQVQTRFFNGPGQWIYLPRAMEVAVSNDGKKFKPAGKFTNFPEQSRDKTFAAAVSFKKNTKVRYLRVTVRRHGIIAPGKQGAGHEAWLFVDEVRVK
ncbi:MAG: family 20 glycosylhydrolase [Saprospiraceae bacterium]|nr:family 20 glycosylhydrolase [Saprospiraceae bacterium]